MALELTSAPASEPLTLDEVRTFLRVTSVTEDDYILNLISVARSCAEDFLNRALIQQTWTLYLRDFPSDAEIVLPLAPLSSVTSVKYYNSANRLTTLTVNTDYYVDAKSQPGRIVLPESVSWPTCYDKPNAVEIVFVAGYGAAASAIPGRILQGMLMHISDMFENRTPVILAGQNALVLPKPVHYHYFPYKLARGEYAGR